MSSFSLDAPNVSTNADCNDIDILKSIVRKQSAVLAMNDLSVSLTDEEESVKNQLTTNMRKTSGISGSSYTVKDKLQCIKLVLDTQISTNKTKDCG